jgi:Coenzyme PQQ synthesis protein D (PqqD)
MHPRARQDRLTIRELPDETLVFDHQRNKAHCLNRTVALVWRHCDGQRDVAELTRKLHEMHHVSADEALVGLALEQLGSRQLLEQPVEPLAGPARLSRRDVLKKLALAAVAMPLVMTITAPNARAAGLLSGMDCSRAKDGTPCALGSLLGACQQGKCVLGADGILVPPAATPAFVKCPQFQCHTLAECPPNDGLIAVACRGGSATVCGRCIYPD